MSARGVRALSSLSHGVTQRHHSTAKARNRFRLHVSLSVKYIEGCQKRIPLQKWLTWFIMTINKDNYNKSCVNFVLAYRYLCVSTNKNV